MAENLNQRWEASDELDFAWFGFASEYEKEQYRNATDRDRMEALSIMMKAELIAKIRNEELYCFGLRHAGALKVTQIAMASTNFFMTVPFVSRTAEEFKGRRRLPRPMPPRSRKSFCKLISL